MRTVGPILLRTKDNLSSPVISGESSIFQSGTKQMLDALLEIIRNSKEILCISSFMIQDSEIIAEVENASERGVQVYMLTAPEHQVNSKYEDDDSDLAERDRAAIDLLRRLGHKVLIKTADHLHSKFLLADPKSEPRGAVFTNNITVRAMNENLELTIMLNPETVNDLFHQFLVGFWEESDREVWLNGSESRLRTEKKHPEFVSPSFTPNNLLWTTKESKSLSNHLMGMIDSAKSSISASAWTFSLENEVSQKILKRAKDGVRVKIFTRGHKNNAPFIREVIELGGEVFCHRLMHAKTLMVDENRGLIMTANFSNLGLESGFETGVLLNSIQTKVLGKIYAEWGKRAQYRSAKEIFYTDIKSEYMDLQMINHTPPEREIEVQSENLNALSMTDYNDGRYNFIPKKGDKYAISEIHVHRLYPPRLPKGSKRIGKTRDGRFELYEHKGQQYICVDNEQDIGLAVQLERRIGATAVSKN